VRTTPTWLLRFRDALTLNSLLFQNLRVVERDGFLRPTNRVRFVNGAREEEWHLRIWVVFEWDDMFWMTGPERAQRKPEQEVVYGDFLRGPRSIRWQNHNSMKVNVIDELFWVESPVNQWDLHRPEARRGPPCVARSRPQGQDAAGLQWTGHGRE
jgi:hypothetical protein